MCNAYICSLLCLIYANIKSTCTLTSRSKSSYHTFMMNSTASSYGLNSSSTMMVFGIKYSPKDDIPLNKETKPNQFSQILIYFWSVWVFYNLLQCWEIQNNFAYDLLKIILNDWK